MKQKQKAVLLLAVVVILASTTAIAADVGSPVLNDKEAVTPISNNDHHGKVVYEEGNVDALPSEFLTRVVCIEEEEPYCQKTKPDKP